MKAAVITLVILLLAVVAWNWRLEGRIDSFERSRIGVSEPASAYSVSDLKARYQAGLEVMNQIIKDLGTLKNALAFADLARSVSDLSNPVNYDLFKSHLSNIQKNLEGGRNQKMRQLTEFASVSNPILSIVTAVVGLFSSRLEKDEREQAYREIMAIAELTTLFQRDLVKFDASIRDLDLKVGLLLDEGKVFHDQLTDTIGLEDDYEEFIAKPSLGLTPFYEKLKEYFEKLADEENLSRAEMVRSIEYYLMQVLRHAHDYHSLLLEIKMVLARLEGTLTSFEVRLKNEPKLNDSGKHLVAAARNSLGNCQKTFSQAYQHPIPEELLLKTQRVYWALP